MTQSFLQQYWWFLISLLGALLVFLLFVQGANSVIFTLGGTSEERKMLINSTGRKWELTFTTLVTFGGAFFASFPLFYSTSFGGAYWLWMIILFTFVLQAVSYEFQNKLGNFLGARLFQTLLVVNGIVGPFLLGCTVGTFFNGSNFLVSHDNLLSPLQPVISSWANASHGLDALLDPWNLCLALAVLMLAQILGTLYIINNVSDDRIHLRARVQLLGSTFVFLLSFLPFLVRTLFKEGYAYNPETGRIFLESQKYFNNLLDMWPLLVLMLVGVVLVLFGIVRTLMSKSFVRGIWPVGVGTVMVVLVLFLIAGWNNTAYYPSNVDLQSSLTIANSSSSLFTLRTMSIVSLLIPFVLAYIVYAWRAIDNRPITSEEMHDGHAY
ncbi:MAG: cytochrome d ubiquinol oxidase subunit II [Bacteroidaceae bacterium]|nr:cytochrome d ubiquinol oxidase subunit II [Prevotellaceae bacterium]MDY5631969.1 cytochrome d ubiquinol oxidase subunit II [Bacteroidaceae bacterium]